MALTIDQLNIQIAANTSQATRALTSLINKLEKLKAALNGGNTGNITISNSFNKVTNNTNKATNAQNKYTTATQKSTRVTRSFSDTLAYNITKFRTLFGVFRSVARVMGDWFTESNDYIETLNLFNVTMGEGAKEARKYAVWYWHEQQEEVIRFFRGSWYELLCDIDPELIIRRLKEEMV